MHAFLKEILDTIWGLVLLEKKIKQGKLSPSFFF